MNLNALLHVGTHKEEETFLDSSANANKGNVQRNLTTKD